MNTISDRPLPGRISVWLRDKVCEANADGLVLGLSGGVDSSVVAALAKMACGDSVLALIMPCHSSPESIDHAQIVAAKIGVRTEIVDLTPVYDTLVQQMQSLRSLQQSRHAGSGIELANIRPRLRMTTLYCAAQALGYLVVGTGNKSEIAIGYFTKWGDGAADLLPLANLYKHQVYELARELGVPQEVIEKAPTADLWAGQTDEDEIGISYDELDAVLQGIESGDMSHLNPESVEHVRKLIASSEHKRRPVPSFEP